MPAAAPAFTLKLKKMKRLKKILIWTALIILLLLGGTTATVLLRQELVYERPYPSIKASSDSAVIARGRELVIGPAHCIDCHSTANADSLLNLGQEVPLDGGVLFNLPVGKIYSSNITSDSVFGIGRRTDAEIARALRYGVHADGTVVFDFMPFHDMADEDLQAVISYIRTQRPVNSNVPAHELNPIGMTAKAFLIQPVGPSAEIALSVKRDSSAAYGKYLALNVANCSGCHTQRSLTGAYIGEPFAGGNPFKEQGELFLPPNLTTSTESRIAGWSQEDFIARFRMGRLHPNSPMPWPSFKRMSDDDLKAIYNYLKTIPPAKTPSYAGEQ